MELLVLERPIDSGLFLESQTFALSLGVGGEATQPCKSKIPLGSADLQLDMESERRVLVFFRVLKECM